MDEVKKLKIRALNDALRKTGKGGELVQTLGFASISKDIHDEFIQLIRGKQEFDEGNDPYGTHEFGAETIGRTTIFWKIDCYNNEKTHLSECPDDPAETKRVMTIMLAEEY